MKAIKLICAASITLIGLFHGFYASGQNLIISDTLRWNSEILVKNSENNAEIFLNFKNSQQKNDNFLPVYTKKIELANEIKVRNLNFVNSHYEILSDSAQNFLTDVDKITEDINIDTYISYTRKQAYFNMEFVPLRRNPLNGKIEKLVSFQLQVIAEQVPAEKSTAVWASSSKLNTGRWHKIKLSNPGIYKLTYEQLVNMGFTDFSTIGIFGYGHMLPKRNSEARYDDLPERDVIRVDVNNDGQFNQGDYLLFYAEGPNRIYYEQTAMRFRHEKHDYSEYAYYFVSDRGSWKQATTVQSEPTYNVTVNSFDNVQFLETDSINVRNMGRTWFWSHFDFYTTHNFSMNFANIITGSPVKFDVALAARSSQSSSFKIYVNNELVNTTNIGYVSGSYSSSYAKEETAVFNHSVNSAGVNFRIEYIKTTGDSEGWLNFIRASARCQLMQVANFMAFRDINSVASGNVAQFIMGNTVAQTQIWDVSDPVNAIRIMPVSTGAEMRFNRDASSLREYIVFNASADFPSPETEGDDLGLVANQNLHALPNPDMIIVTYPGFRAQAEQIAQIHSVNDGMNTLVVEPWMIYNEFSSGCPDVAAIRDFVRMFYERANTDNDIPDNLLLLGDGSYDNKAESGVNGNYVPTFQAVNSFSPSSAFVSDDFYVMLDPNEGNVTGYDNLDMGIGRITVKSVSEAQAVVNKISSYYASAHLGSWRNIMSFIGDDAEDYTIHQFQANELAEKVAALYPVYNIDKIFLDAYEQVSTVQGARYPEVNQAIDDRVRKGTLVMNYTGHGNTKTLAHEVVVDISQILSWNNADRFAIFVTATCEFSRFDDPTLVSAGEQILLNPQGGGIALFTTTRLVQATSNFNLNLAFYDYFFERDAEMRPLTMGQIIMKTKNALSSDSNKRNFALLGDPALRPAIPNYQVVTTSINGVDIDEFNDTVGARSRVTVTGIVRDHNGNKITNFRGKLYPTVYDKKMTYFTRGNDGKPPLEYTEQMNVLFRGQTSVVDGDFSFSFIVPVDIAYFFGNGKISYYAHNYQTDAHGHYSDLIIGGSSDSEINDIDGPEISLFMNSDDFIAGGITDEKPIMLAYVSDSSGINTVGSGIGHDIIAILDENTQNSIVLNDYYQSNLDDYTSGSINYPFSNLDLGPHTLSLKVWDVLNNSSIAYTDFIVARSHELVIDQVFNYPNPFSTNTQFYFNHNQPNVPMDVIIQVFTVSGKLVKNIEAVVISDGFRSQPISWNALDDFGDRLAKGVYIYKLMVKAPNGNIAQQTEKLFILN